MLRPIRVPFTIPYGAQFGAARAGGKRRHRGTDYHVPVGTPIYGTDDGGVVESVGFNGDPWTGAGHYIVIRYPSGRTTDMHKRERTLLRLGQAVGPTTVIGYVGLTGNAVNADPPGSHLHHERRKLTGLLMNPENVYTTETAGSNITPIEITPEPINLRDDTMLKITATGRGQMLVAANYLRILSPNNGNEEVHAADQIADRAIDVSPARFDTIRDLVTSGRLLSLVDPVQVGTVQVIDYAALAKAVNDDAARRLSS